MSTCTKCGKPIRWQKTKNNKWQAMEPDERIAEPHAAVCSKPEGYFTRPYWIPREAVKNRNIKSNTTNPSKRKSFYRGARPPWDYPDFIDCIGKGA